ncbi:MAG: glycosyltransferase, partial [Candidatus Nanohaloarchaea archaeon]|nr:glycosyltransferase [Candidatus Nanohaloarchaea archaeon]
MTVDASTVGLHYFVKNSAIRIFTDQLYDAAGIPTREPPESSLPVLQGTDRLRRQIPRLVDSLAQEYDSIVVPSYIMLANVNPTDYPDTTIIPVIHDLYKYFDPSHSRLARFNASHAVRNAQRCTSVIANSATTKTVLQHTLYAEHRSRITAVPPGVDTDVFHDTDDQPQSVDTVDYLLYVGSFNPRKNPKFLVNVLAAADIDCSLVLAGNYYSDEYRDEVLQHAVERGVRDRITHVGRVSEDELRRLYSNAAAYLYPAIRDGYGMTPVEAAACGTPPILHQSVPAVDDLGDAAATYTDFDAATVADVVADVSGKRFDYSPRTWQDAAAEFL